MKKFLFCMFLLTLTFPIQAQTKLIPFQARLTDAGNQVVPDNVYNIVFKVYDAATGGTPLWSENHLNVSVIGGQINVLLGSLTPLNFTFEADKFLAITIGTGPEMVPRHQLVPSFHAQSASLAHEAEKLGGKEPAWYASKEYVTQKIADATADIGTTTTEIDEIVSTHTAQIQNNLSAIQDVSSDVNLNLASINELNTKVKTSTAILYQSIGNHCPVGGPYTFSSTCQTVPCAYYEGTPMFYYTCDGSCPINDSSVACNNIAIGNLLYE